MTKTHTAFVDEAGKLHYTEAQATRENLRLALYGLKSNFGVDTAAVTQYLADNREEIITRLVALRPA